MSDSSAQSLKQLKIKTGVVKRLHKEESIYTQEVVDQKKVIEKLKANDADGADIRAAERVLRDSEMMIPRTKSQLEEAVQALDDLVNALQSEDAISSSAEYKDAVEQLKQVQAA
ncbi:co-chaperone [Kwoniella mangroviensis CBS 10435]|uniref:Tubulin-specific chaperone A n=1 Tax=Kwoniella mangroviensis CBS 10435 TaxID=1331196 RepID=A0A1B9J3H2_9TREE|nr:co-chaperone [Kwoniella mangroviensis CBS 8507]OCF62337.1 co-chaperone [Kwoniella mangroviensis CBS 10435]OCF64282.1 co-chaperone [Kwoniella mangroviensis CBS 8507]OCF73098.1 co-chaperone [Kwoniella mangroviensis CBS 8886]